MSNGCRIKNTCSYSTTTNCVDFVGVLLSGTYISVTGCDATLTDYIEEIDRLLKELKDADGVSKQLLTQYNCGFETISELIAGTTGTKALTASTIIALLRALCDLQARVVELEEEDIFERVLPQEIQLLINSKLDCLDVDPCNSSTLTLKDLLTKLIYKVCP